jgi:hypothetical protein
MNQAEQATKGLDVIATKGIVRVSDGVDTWLCEEAAYDAAVSGLEGVDAIDDEDGEAYTALCTAVRGPIATVVGSPRGEWRELVRRAVAADLVDPDDASRMFGVEVRP